MREETERAVDYYAKCEAAAKEAGDNELCAEVAADLAELHMREAERLAGRDKSAAASHAERYKYYLDLETKYVADFTLEPARVARIGTVQSTLERMGIRLRRWNCMRSHCSTWMPASPPMSS